MHEHNAPSKRTYFSKTRYLIGILISVFSLFCCFVSFSTPYWLQSWPRVHTPVKRIGLWEFCLNGYRDRLDKKSVGYFDCWWILSPYLKNIYTQLVPFWFIIIQVLVTISLIILVVSNLMLLLLLCEFIEHIARKAFTVKLLIIGHALSAILLFPAVVIFGANWNNPNWMPNPDLNWPSWSYGFCILSLISSIFGVLFFTYISRETKVRTKEALMNFPMAVHPSWNVRKEQMQGSLSNIPKSTKDEFMPLISHGFHDPKGSFQSGLSSGQNFDNQYNPKTPSVMSERSVMSNRSKNTPSIMSNQPSSTIGRTSGTNRQGYYDDRDGKKVYLDKGGWNGSEMSA